MGVLALCVLSNIALVLCFKLYPRYGVDTFTAIVLNYWISTALGSLMLGHIPLFTHVPFDFPWMYAAVALGILFITGFTVIGLSVRYVGMAITSTMQKMSLLLSTSFALIFYHEPAGILKVSGILLSIVAVVMVTYHKTSGQKAFVQLLPFLVLPLGALLFSGAIESILYYVQAESLVVHGNVAFTTYAFGIAGIIGAVILIIRVILKQHRVTWRDVAGSIALGTPNFFSIYLILVLLKLGFPGSVLYPVLDIIILILSAIIGLVVFRERLNRINIAGLVIALLAIILVSMAL